MKHIRVTKEQIEAIKQLRYKGYSLPEISRELGIKKTTAFRYMNKFPIGTEFIKAWKGKRGGSTKRMEKKQKQILEEATKAMSNFSNRERKLFLAALYWAEGSKGDFGLSNTDPYLIKVFVNGLREVFEISEDRLRISIRIYEDLDREACLNFWSEVVSVPKDRFVSVNVLSGKKKGKLVYGMCRVRVAKGGDLLKQMKAICKVISDNLAS